MRWGVQINDIIGEGILADVLASAGLDLHGDMLSGQSFEALDDWRAVSDLAQDIAHRLREVSRLNPDVEIGFSAGPVHEYDTNGKEIHVHRKVYAQGAAVFALCAHVAGVGTVSSSLTPEERAELERRTRAERAGELVCAALHSDLVLTVMRLLDGEPGTMELCHAHDLIKDDVAGNLSGLATKSQFKRFTRSINHPDVLGLKARHAVTTVAPPPDPMSLEEATAFIREVAQRWIKEKAKGLNHKG